MFSFGSKCAALRAPLQMTSLKPAARYTSLLSPRVAPESIRAFSGSTPRPYDGPQPPRQVPPHSSRQSPRKDNPSSHPRRNTTPSQNEEKTNSNHPRIMRQFELEAELRKAGYNEDQINAMKEQMKLAILKHKKRRRNFWLLIVVVGALWIVADMEQGRAMKTREKELERREREVAVREAKVAGVNAYDGGGGGQQEVNDGVEKWE